METEDQEKPATYHSCVSEMEDTSEKDQFKFNETDTTTVIRRSHVRLDLQAAGLGPRPPSVISSDQEYPPLEHKDIPVPSPYVKKLQQNEESALRSDAECRIQSKPNVEDNFAKNQHIVLEQMKINSTETHQNAVIKSRVDDVCQKTVSNAKNDQIKISVKEKIAKNREEVSGKRSSFADAEGKLDSVDKSVSGTNSIFEASNLELLGKESAVDDEKRTKEVLKPVLNSKKECVAAVNSVFSKKTDNIQQPQTTWEQEKQKAELAKLRLTENTQPTASLGIISQKNSSRKQQSTECITSESGFVEDSDSSDTKTVINADCVRMDAQITTQNNSGGIMTTPLKSSIDHITPMTPDTMTPDEAENLLSSR